MNVKSSDNFSQAKSTPQKPSGRGSVKMIPTEASLRSGGQGTDTQVSLPI
jgi:hypothetical protein